MKMPSYWGVSLTKFKAEQLRNMIEEAHENCDLTAAPCFGSVADMRAQLSIASQNATNRLHAAAREAVVRVLVGITATECNAWLTTLPPTPLYGEDTE